MQRIGHTRVAWGGRSTLLRVSSSRIQPLPRETAAPVAWSSAGALRSYVIENLEAGVSAVFRARTWEGGEGVFGPTLAIRPGQRVRTSRGASSSSAQSVHSNNAPGRSPSFSLE